jgi:hypothetical protein
MVFGAKPAAWSEAAWSEAAWSEAAWSETEGNDQFSNFWRHAFLLNRTDNH